MIVQPKETAQASKTLLYENITSMFSRLTGPCRQRSVWVFSNTCIPALLELSVAIALGGQHVPVLQESNGEFRLLTRPCFFSEKLAEIGSVGDCLLVDPSQYIIGLRKEVAIDTSRHAYFSSDEIAFRAILRVDGMPGWNSVVTPRNGTTTLSWACALAER
ncbi:MAG TPA: phage major capsid protein [Thermoguttaceae bacterium]|nr:phage major capsid protein [Thermoguttaceae bacterium]